MAHDAALQESKFPKGYITTLTGDKHHFRQPHRLHIMQHTTLMLHSVCSGDPKECQGPS